MSKIRGFLSNYKEDIGRAVLCTLISTFTIGLLYLAVTETPYPRTYELAEDYVFKSEPIKYKNYRGGYEEWPSGLCIVGYRFSDQEKPTCIHHRKAEQVNPLLEQARREDKDGVIWEGANGNGEYWIIERNNYRFIITAKKDENFK